MGWRSLSCLLLCGVVLAGPLVQAGDRYFTWVDEHGQVRHTLIRDEESPVEKRVEQVRNVSVPDTDKKPVAAEPASVPAPETVEVKPESGTPQPESDGAPPPDRPSVSPESASTATTLAEPPQPPVSAQNPPTVDTLLTPRDQEKSPPRPATDSVAPDNMDYTLENYPDGDELARRGFIREGDPLPYYTWRDAQGNVRVDYYRPEPGFEKTRRDHPTPPLSTALVIDRTRQSSSPKANPETLAVLGIDQTETLLQSWMDQCCVELPVRDLADWDDSREFQLEMDNMAPEFRFSTGPSVYRLVRLPAADESTAFVIQVRSYLDDGVFVPTLAFLDKDMQTRRLVTDLVFDFTPESWHSHGFLEARIPAFPDAGDRWLLIMSRQEDQGGQTVIETGQGPEVIPHARHGTLGLARLGR